MINWKRATIPFVFAAAVVLPPGRTLARPQGDPGKAIYESRCVECHGRDGKGNGPAAALLHPRPRDFTSGKYKFRSTESGSIPTDDDLLNSVKNGLHATSMPDWKPFIGGDSLKSVVAYMKSFSGRFAAEKPKVVSVGTPVPSSASSIASGKKAYEKLQCGACHGSDGAGKDALTTEFQDDWGFDLKATNLTEPWTFRGGASPRDVYLRFRTGIDGSPMPSFVGSATDREMWDLANYVVSIGRKPLWSMNEKEVIAFYAGLAERGKQNPAERGKYLVKTIGCGFCHTPVRDDGTLVEEMQFAGGQRWDLYPFENYVSYNLTSDKETGLGSWTDDQVKAVLRKGIRRNGTRMLPYPMPWPAFASLTEEDLDAIIAYLRTIPPVYNRIPEPKAPGIFSYFWGKFRLLVLKKDIPLRVFPGNAGDAKSTSTAEARQ